MPRTPPRRVAAASDMVCGLFPARLRAGHYTGARAKAWCLLIHAKASLSHMVCGQVIVKEGDRVID